MRNYNMVHKMNKQQIYNYYILFIYIYRYTVFRDKNRKGKRRKSTSDMVRWKAIKEEKIKRRNKTTCLLMYINVR